LPPSSHLSANTGVFFNPASLFPVEAEERPPLDEDGLFLFSCHFVTLATSLVSAAQRDVIASTRRVRGNLALWFLLFHFATLSLLPLLHYLLSAVYSLLRVHLLP
jgi:hypothetical protein